MLAGSVSESPALVVRSLPRFHLRSTALLDCSMCEASGSRSLGGGSVTNLVATHHISCTTLQLHITHGLHFPSTIAPITQLSPITHLPWLSHHTCTSFTHTHISSTLPCTHCKVLFSPVWHFQAFSLTVFTWTAYTTLTVCWLPFDPACHLISSLSAACPDLCIAPVADSALPSLHLLLSLNLACLTSSCLAIKLHLDLTTLPLHYNLP